MDIRMRQYVNFNGVRYPLMTLSNTDIADYNGLKNMYYGSGGFKDGTYLVKHPTEDELFYDARRKLAHYENAFAPELDASIDPIFSKDQIRTLDGEALIISRPELNGGGSAKAIVESFVYSPTKRNETMSEYMRRIEMDTRLFGTTFIVEDAPTDVPENGSQDGNPKFMPYSYYLTPLNISGYNFDENGALSMLVYAEDVSERYQRPHEISKATSTDVVYRVWLKDIDGNSVTFQYQNDAVIANTLVGLDYLPVLLREDNTREDESYICKSRYLPMVGLAKKMYNLESLVDDSYFKNCFAFLAINGTVPKDLDLANNAVFNYMGVNVNSPEYIAPPMDHISSMNEKNTTHRTNMKEDLNSTVIISSVASGESREAADKRRIEILKKSSKDLSEVETWLVDVALRLYISGVYTYNVIYVDDFESLTKKDSIANYQSLIDSGAMSQEVIKEIGVDMIAIIYSNDPERRDELIDLQIATNNFDQEVTISENDEIEIEEG